MSNCVVPLTPLTLWPLEMTCLVDLVPDAVLAPRGCRAAADACLAIWDVPVNPHGVAMVVGVLTDFEDGTRSSFIEGRRGRASRDAWHRGAALGDEPNSVCSGTRDPVAAIAFQVTVVVVGLPDTASTDPSILVADGHTVMGRKDIGYHSVGGPC